MNRWGVHKSLHNKTEIQDKPEVEYKLDSPTKVIIKSSLWFALLLSVVVSFSSCIKDHQIHETVEEKTSSKEYQFTCENSGFGLSVVDVLQATGALM